MRIGVFDSGLGGLTVLRALMIALPEAEFFYLGDTAHLPYGSKSPETIQKLSLAASTFLVDQGIDALVIACHTASAWAASRIQQSFRLPVFDMIGPTIRRIEQSSYQGAIGILGTRAMIQSGVYQNLLQDLGPRVVISQPCPLFVPLVEEGYSLHALSHEIARAHLYPLQNENVDTVVLGCTHYPALLSALKNVLPNVREWINPAETLAKELSIFCDPYEEKQPSIMEAQDLPRILKAFVTDDPTHFMEMSSLFLGMRLSEVEWISLDKAPAGHCS